MRDLLHPIKLFTPLTYSPLSYPSFLILPFYFSDESTVAPTLTPTFAFDAFGFKLPRVCGE